MVLEYINGGSLQDFINVARGERLLAEQVLANIAHDVTFALSYCHSMGLVCFHSPLVMQGLTPHLPGPFGRET